MSAPVVIHGVEIQLGMVVEFTGVNAYMGLDKTYSGRVIRRNKHSLTVKWGYTVCTVPFEFVTVVAPTA